MKIAILLDFCFSTKAIAAGPSCESAYKSGSQSPSIGDVMDAIEVSNKEKAASWTDYVAANSDGPETGDGRYVGAACELIGSYGANKAVTKNKKATKVCERAKSKANKSPSNAVVLNAADTCAKETTKICAKKADGTGDGRLIAAVCALNAAYGSYKEVSSQTLSIDNKMPAEIAPTKVEQ